MGKNTLEIYTGLGNLTMLSRRRAVWFLSFYCVISALFPLLWLYRSLIQPQSSSSIDRERSLRIPHRNIIKQPWWGCDVHRAPFDSQFPGIRALSNAVLSSTYIQYDANRVCWWSIQLLLLGHLQARWSTNFSASMGVQKRITRLFGWSDTIKYSLRGGWSGLSGSLKYLEQIRAASTDERSDWIDRGSTPQLHVT